MRETEMRNPDSMHIDKMSTSEMIDVINRENRKAFLAVEDAKEQIEKAVDAAAETLRNGGRLFYVGAGTSGRLGVIDASECPPTYGVSPETVTGLLAGGKACMYKDGEPEEDSPELGAKDLVENGASKNDAVMGISAAGSAPYVIGALQKARALGCRTIALSSNENAPIFAYADIPILTRTGPEVVTGSTRMKAGTAQKLVLNTISTCAMIKNGMVYENLMINLRPTNEKLRARMIGIVVTLTGKSEEEAVCLLEKSGWDIRSAVKAAGGA